MRAKASVASWSISFPEGIENSFPSSFFTVLVKAHRPLNKEVCTFCSFTSCERTAGLKLSHTAWFTLTLVRFSQFLGRWYLLILSWSFSSGSPSLSIEFMMIANSLSTSGLVSSFRRSCFRLFNTSLFPSLEAWADLLISDSYSGDFPDSPSSEFSDCCSQRFFAGGSTTFLVASLFGSDF